MPISPTSRRRRFRVLQTGSLPLRPDGSHDRLVEHRCTSVLIWPADEPPDPDNALITDPCFTDDGFAQARRVFGEVGVGVPGLRHAFMTHGHHDHWVWLPASISGPWPRPVADEDLAAGDGLDVVPCPGHSDDSRSLIFLDENGRQVWVAGDAVLDREWLLAWGYYWPNLYEPEEVIQTWRSVAKVLSANVIVPGHGEPIEVTAALVRTLLERWPLAELARRCPEVPKMLQRRQEA